MPRIERAPGNVPSGDHGLPHEAKRERGERRGTRAHRSRRQEAQADPRRGGRGDQPDRRGRPASAPIRTIQKARKPAPRTSAARTGLPGAGMGSLTRTCQAPTPDDESRAQPCSASPDSIPRPCLAAASEPFSDRSINNTRPLGSTGGRRQSPTAPQHRVRASWCRTVRGESFVIIDGSVASCAD